MEGKNSKPADGPRRKSSPLAAITWAFIVLLLILIAAWTLWAGHKANLPSMWAPD
jgi:hypothetical protein